MNARILFIRNETFGNEFRTPIVPKDIKRIHDMGFEVYVESSNTRCYCDNEYKENGAIIVNDNWINYNKNTLIIGLKELDKIEYLNHHTHIYFSHTFKNQKNSEYILKKFKQSNSKLYDLEYFVDSNNRRLIAFGYYAGIVGAALGLMQYITKITTNRNIKDLSHFDSFDNMVENIHSSSINKPIKIALIGPNGRCGSGVKFLLDKFILEYDCYAKEDTKLNLEKYDILYNCINLTEKINPWLDENTQFYKNMVIVDISCDYTNEFNPIKLYNDRTTWKDPVFNYNKFVDIIAIDNLPSLLPMESSNEFSDKFVQLLKDYEFDSNKWWLNNLNTYMNKIKNLD